MSIKSFHIESYSPAANMTALYHRRKRIWQMTKTAYAAFISSFQILFYDLKRAAGLVMQKNRVAGI